MRPGKTRFVATCQQLLVLCAVGAALAPAVTLVSLDVVQQHPVAGGTTQHGAARPGGALAAYTQAALAPALVSDAPVDPVVREVPLTAAVPTGSVGRVMTGRVAPSVTPSARIAAPAPRTTVVTSTPQPVTGYGTVGVTWEHGDDIPEDAIALRLRTEKDGVWTGWKKMEYHDDHGPDAGSAEAKRERPGTMESLVGHVDEVQVKMTVTGVAVPPDMKLAVIDPGFAPKSSMEPAAIDTARVDPSTSTAPDTMTPAVAGEVGGVATDAIPGLDGGSDAAVDAGTGTADPAATDGTTGEDATGGDAVMAAASYTPRPQIFSRAQWGADESIREKSSLHYDEVHGGFVHHTVNANDYTRAEVPAILRSIYAYHVKSRGWSDIGYNFLIDKFGRIWEGRYGGVDRPVVGAHTENYNDWSFGVSAIGNYDIAKPSKALIQAEGALFAWKLSLHGVSAAATNVKIGPRVFASSIMGHRDTKATACPGRYLYAKIPQIRQIAASLQAGWGGRQLQSNLAGSAYPDLIARRASDGRGVILPTGGLVGFNARTAPVATLATGTRAVLSPDLTGDGRSDLVEAAPNGAVTVLAGSGTGAFATTGRRYPRLFRGTDLLTAVGDVNGDGRNDLVARNVTTHQLVRFLRTKSGFRKVAGPGADLAPYTTLVGTGDVNGDGHRDLLAGNGTGLWLYAGTAQGTFSTTRVPVPGDYAWSTFDQIVGYGDYSGDGIADLVVRNAKTHNGFILPGDGHGGFGHALGPITRVAAVGSLVAGGQIVGDASPDLLVANGTTLSVLPNTGRTDLGKPIVTNLSLGKANLLLRVGDWNGDGKGDLVVRRGDGRLYLYLGHGNGTFDNAKRIAAGFGPRKVVNLAAVGDVTGDGLPDLQGQKKGGAVYIWPGRGSAGLGAGYVSHAAIAGTRQIGAGLWNGDGAPDSLYVRSGRLVLYSGDGPGGLTAGVQRTLRGSVAAYPFVTAVSNLQGAGHTDLLARDKRGRLFALRYQTNGKLSKPFYLGAGLSTYNLIG